MESPSSTPNRKAKHAGRKLHGRGHSKRAAEKRVEISTKSIRSMMKRRFGSKLADVFNARCRVASPVARFRIRIPEWIALAAEGELRPVRANAFADMQSTSTRECSSPSSIFAGMLSPSLISHSSNQDP